MLIIILFCIIFTSMINEITIFANDRGIPELLGIHIEESNSFTSEDGTNVIEEGKSIKMRLFGQRFTNETIIAFTETPALLHTDCNDFSRSAAQPLIYINNKIALIKHKFISLKYTSNNRLYICLKTRDSDDKNRWYHQGSEPYLTILVKARLMPVGYHILIVLFLLCLSGLFAGLNLGLMSLDKNELKVIASKGHENERRYARTIEPLRKRGNFLLCSILLSNVLINSTLTVLLDQLTTGIIAVAISTLSIVIIGDIVPQAICSRHGLAIGAKTIWITYIFMIITSPLSYPISKILDILLGDEIGQVYDRERLMEFIRITKDYNNLEAAEVNIISGALELRHKTVGEIMTRLEDVFMLPINSQLDFETVSLIQKVGYSRIPVYSDERKNIVALFYAKDLAFVDPDDKMPLRTVIEFYKHPIIFTFDDTTLDVALGAFKEGKSHLAFVRHLYDSDYSDPYYEVTGVVTLEDVIEEILQTEIIDETDILTDNRLKQRRKIDSEKCDFKQFTKIGEGQESSIVSPQMILATYQFLSSSCEPFTKDCLDEPMLQKLISQKIYFHHLVDEDETKFYKLYTCGQPVDYFVMILEGRVKVTAGQEKLSFFSGPFSYFGIDVLRTDDNQDYIPDFTVEIVKTTIYIKINRKIYWSARKAFLMKEMNYKFDGKEISFQNNKDLVTISADTSNCNKDTI